MLDYIKAIKLEYKLRKLLKSENIRVDREECYFAGKVSYTIFYPLNSNNKLIKKVNYLEMANPDIFLLIKGKFLKIYAHKIEEFIKDIKMTNKRWMEVIANIIRDKYHLRYDLVSIHKNELAINTISSNIAPLSHIFNLQIKTIKGFTKIYQIDNPIELYTLFKITSFIN